ncbi:MAG: hypothetical protein ACREGC_02085 [Minisyncoccia bacterium]
MLIKNIVRFFDKLEDKIRGKLSHYPIIYAFIGGVGIILFWRGVWEFANDINIGSIVSIVIGMVILLLTGVFVAGLIGSRLIISGLIGEKKLSEKAEDEIETEESQLKNLQNTLTRIEKEITKIEENKIK